MIGLLEYIVRQNLPRVQFQTQIKLTKKVHLMTRRINHTLIIEKCLHLRASTRINIVDLGTLNDYVSNINLNQILA